MTFAEIGVIVLPVFGLIGLGFLASRFGLVGDRVGDGLGDFVNVIGIPLLIFRTVGTAHFPDQSPWPLWFAYFGGVIVAWALGTLIATRVFGRSRTEGVIAGACASFSNTVMVGVPLIVSAYGEAGALPLFMLISVHLPVMMVVGTLMTERAARLDRGAAEPFHLGRVLMRILRNLVTNALVIALAAGALWRMTGLPLTGVPRTVIDQLASAAVPCALFALGIGLKRYGLFGEFRIAAALSVVKLLVMPAFVLVLAHFVFGLTPLWTAVLTVTAGCPSGVNAYLFAVRFDTAHGTASNSIGLSTALAGFTMVLLFNAVVQFG
jgi:malonate transporter